MDTHIQISLIHVKYIILFKTMQTSMYYFLVDIYWGILPY